VTRAARAIAWLGIVPVLLGAGLGVGGKIPPFEISDQHGNARHVGAAVRAIVFGRDMTAAGIVREALEGHEALLASAGAVYVADVSGMPRLVRRLIAVPRMRRLPYPVLLDDDGSRSRDFPHDAERVSVIRLGSSVIEGVEHVDSAAALRAALEALARDDAGVR